MVLLFGVCFLLLLVSAPIIVLRFGIRPGSKRELERSNSEIEQPEQE
jgi:hypothetical protein